MNCCEKYGDCQQGRRCPVRQERVRKAKELLDRMEKYERPWRVVQYIALALAVLIAICVGGLIHDAVKAVA